jgi:prepilin-type N-terminal cleavage/methylation domain-containing protein
MKKAFTLIELIFAIVIIGVLASVAVPQFSGLSQNSKIASEDSTAASVQVAIDACHGEWIINEGSFTCGANIASTSLNSNGYPTSLGTNFDQILKKPASGWTTSGSTYTGPAGREWEYDATKGTFSLK